MIYLFLNLFLATAWMLLNGDYSSLQFLLGFVVGFGHCASASHLA